MAELLNDNDEGSADDEIVIVETDPNAKTDDSDEKPRAGAGSDDDERSARANATGDDSDSEREAIRERRRLEKLERKDRRDKAISRDKLELDFLRNRNDDLERRLTAQEQRAAQSDLNSYDQAINQARHEAEMADQVIAKAVAVGNGEDVTKAMRYRDEALARVNQLSSVKHQHQQASAAPRQAAPGIDPTVVEHIRDFMEDHPWYNTQGRDEDSAIVLAIDSALVREGFDPKSDDYWDELRHRAARRLPERFKQDKAPAPAPREARGGPALGSGREHAPVSTRKEVYISPERKQALMDAGVWDDPVLRMKYVKRYSDYDRANRA